MEMENWKSIIINWANALEVSSFEVKEVPELISSGVLYDLVRFMENGDIPSSETVHGGEHLRAFIKDHFTDCEILPEEAWDDQEIIIIATLLLIYSSLAENFELRSRLYKLPENIQVTLMTFIQFFVGCEKRSLARNVIIDGIERIELNTGKCETTDETLGEQIYSFTPKRNSILFASVTSTPTTEYLENQRKTRELKKLKSEVELLIAEKTDLENELTSAKSSVDKLMVDMRKKDNVIRNLKFNLEEREKVETPPSQRKQLNWQHNNEIRKLKDEISSLESTINTLHDDVRVLERDKRELGYKLSGAEKRCDLWQKRTDACERENLELSEKISTAEKHIEELRATCKDQKDLINDLQIDRSILHNSMSSMVIPESLGTEVIDLQLRELQEVHDEQSALLAEKDENLRKLNAQFQDLEEKLTKQIKEGNECTKKVQEKEEIIKTLSSDLKKLEDKLIDQLDKENKLKINIQQIQIERNELHSGIKKTSELLKETELINGQFKEDLKLTKDLLNTRETELDNYRVEITAKNEKLSSLECLLKSLQDNEKKMKATIDCLQKDKDLNVKQIQDLKNTLSTTEEKGSKTIQESNEIIRKLNSDVKELEDKLTNQLDEENKLKINIQQIQIERDELHSGIKKTSELLMETELINGQFKEDLKLTKDLLNTREKELNNYTLEITANNEKLSSLECLLKSLQDNEKEMKATIDCLKKDKDLNVKQIQNLKNTLSITEEKVSKTIQESNETIRKLNSDVKELEDKLTNQLDEENKLKIKIEQIQIERDELHSGIKKTSELLKETELINGQFKEDLKVTKDLLNTRETELDNHRVELTAKNEKLSSLECLLKSLQDNEKEMKAAIECLQKDKDLNVEQIQDLKNTLSTTEEKGWKMIEERDKTIRILNSDVKELEERLANKLDEENKLKIKIEQIQIERDELHSGIKKTSELLKETELINGQFKEDLKLTKDLLNTRETELGNHRVELTAKNEKLSSLECLLKSLQDNEKEMKATIECLQKDKDLNVEQIQDLKNTLSTTEEKGLKMIEERDETIRKLNSDVKELEERLANKLDEENKLKIKIEQIQIERDELHSGIKKTSELLKETELINGQFKEDLKLTKDLLNTRETELDNHRVELTAKNEKLSSLECLLKSLQDNEKELKATIECLLKDRDLNEKQIQDLKNTLTITERKGSKTIQKRDETIRKLKLENKELEDKLTNQLNEENKLKINIQQIQIERDELHSGIKKMSELLKETELINGQFKEDLKVTKDLLNTREKELNNYRVELTEKNEKISSIECLLRILQDNEKEMTATIECLLKDKEFNEKQIHDLKNMLSASEEKGLKKIEERDDTIRKLSSDVKELVDKLTNQLDEENKLKINIQQIQIEIDELHSSNKETSEQLKETILSNEQIKEKLKLSKETLNTRENELNNHRVELTAKNKKLSVFESLLKSLQNDKKELNTNIECLLKEKDSNVKQIQELKNKLSSTEKKGSKNIQKRDETIRKLNSVVKELEDKLLKQLEEENKLKINIQQIQIERNELHTSNKETSEQLKDTLSVNGQIKEDLKLTKDLLNTRETELDNYRVELTTKNEKLSSLECLLKSLQDNEKEMKATIDCLLKEKDLNEKQIRDLKTTITSTEKKGSKIIQKRDETIKKLKLEKKELEDKLTVQLDEENKLKINIQKIKIERDELHSGNTEKSKQLRETELNNGQIKEDLKLTKDLLNKREKELDNYRVELTAKNEKFSSLECLLKSLQDNEKEMKATIEDLLKETDLNEKQIQDLKKTLSATEEKGFKNIKDRDENIRKLTSKIKELEDKLTNQLDEENKLKIKIEQIQIERDELHSGIKKTSELLKETELINGQFKEDLKLTKDLLNTREKELNNYTLEITAKNEKLSSLECLFKSLQDNEKDMKATIDCLKKDKDLNVKQIQDLKNTLSTTEEKGLKMIEERDETIRKLNSDVKELEERLANKLDEENKLKIKIEQIQIERDELHNGIKKTSELLKETELINGQFKEDLKLTKDLLNTREKELNNYTLEITAKKEKLSSLDCLLKSLQDNEKEMKATIDCLQKDKDLNVEQIQDLKNTLSTTEEKGWKMIEERDETIRKLNSDVKELEEKLTNQLDEENKLKINIQQIQIERNELHSGIKKTSELLKETELINCQFKEDLKLTKDLLNTRETELDNHRIELTAKNEKLSSLDCLLKSLQDNEKEMKATIDCLKKDKDLNVEQIQDLKNTLSTTEGKGLKMIEERDETIRKLNSDVKELEERLANKLDEENKLKIKIEQIQIERDELHSGIKKTSELLKETELINGQFKEDLKLTKDLLNTRETELDNHRVELTAKNEKLSSLECLLKSLQDNEKEMKATIECLLKDRDLNEKQIQDLKNTLTITEGKGSKTIQKRDETIRKLKLENKELEDKLTNQLNEENKLKINIQQIQIERDELHSGIKKTSELLKETELINGEFMEDLKVTKDLLNTREKELNNYRVELTEKNEKLSSIECLLRILQDNEKEMTATIECLLKDKEINEKQIQDLKNMLSTSEEKGSKKAQENDKIISKLNSDLNEFENKLTDLVDEGHKFKIKIQEIQIERDDLLVRNIELKESEESLIKQIGKENELKITIEQILFERNNLQEKNIEQSKQIQDLKLNMEQLMKDSRLKKDLLNTYTKQLNDCKLELSDKNDKLLSLISSFKTFEQDVNDKNEKIINLELLLNSLQQDMKEKNAEVERLSNEKYLKEGEIQSLKNTLNTTEKKCAKLLHKGEIADKLNMEINNLEHKILEQIEKENEVKLNLHKIKLEKEKLLSCKAEEINEIESKNESLLSHLELTKESLNAREKELNDCYLELTLKDDKLLRLESSLKSFEFKLDEKNETIEHFLKEKVLNEKQITDLKSHLNAAEQKCAKLIERDSIVEKQIVEINDLEQKVLEHVKRENELKMNLQQINYEKDELLTLKENEKSSLEVLLKNVQQEVEEKNEKLESLLMEKVFREEELASKNTEISKLEGSLYKIQLEINEKNEEIERLASLTKVLEEKKEAYKNNCARVVETLKKRSKQIEELKEKTKYDSKLPEYYDEKLNEAKKKLMKKYNEAQEALKSKYEEQMISNHDEAEKKINELKKDFHDCKNERDLFKKLYDELNKEMKTLKMNFKSSPMYCETPSKKLKTGGSSLFKALSLEKGTTNPVFDDSLNDVISIDETMKDDRRLSIRSIPAGLGKKFFPSGKIFPAEEEEGELFDNRYLSDLKAGVCRLPDNSDRLSILMSRNSLCPPHLKSSYAAETQFMTLNEIKEEDIKKGPAKQSLPQRRSKTQILYKKPGPPTPSKTGGRQSLQGGEQILPQGQRFKENTPSRMMRSLFGKKGNDEPSTPVSPRRNRRSLFPRWNQ